MQSGFAAAPTGVGWSPRLAIRIFLNTVDSRGVIACARCACHAIWLRRCADWRRLVPTIGDQDLVEH